MIDLYMYMQAHIHTHICMHRYCMRSTLYVVNIYMCGSFTSYGIFGEALEAVCSLGSCGSSIFSCTCTFCMACIPVSGC